ncbi:MAG: B12-binding domain-containing radical SAM protein [Dehalococcoidales bacterium]|nr:B12-binding domain-containing radical SAM protein [Dehalococcoidales bacterium]
MKILMVYPQFPETFWSFKHALKFVSKKASYPPLGLLTVAAMLPAKWEKRLVDMNVDRLKDDDIAWADYVFLSAMAVQKESVAYVIERVHDIGGKIVAGGPLFTMEPDEYREIDHLVLGEAEGILAEFVADLEAGVAKPEYRASAFPAIEATPVPDWSLITMKNYSSMALQYSRGCPFNCEFCDIVLLNGHRPRTKSSGQLIGELDSLYAYGWRDGVFVVDDNFIGNKKKLKTEILPAVIDWRKGRKSPFPFNTEASIDLADDDELIKLMVEAGFGAVFVGIETPNEESLVECTKNQNRNRDLAEDVRKLHNAGLEVQGGFIVGFDSDPLSIFKSQINFIQKTGIVTAMVGLLNAPPGTRLFQRLKKENRIVGDFDGTNMATNFIPKMNPKTLLDGYKHILRSIYSPREYYQRVGTFLHEFKPPKLKGMHLGNHHLKALWKSFWILGWKEQGKRYYWRLMLVTFFKRPRSFPVAVKLAIYGYHFRRIVEKYVGEKMGLRATEKSFT